MVFFVQASVSGCARRFLMVAASLAVALAGCALEPRDSAEAEPVAALQARVGDPVDGHPSYDELVELVAINRVRADPNNQTAGTSNSCSTVKQPAPPVMFDFDLGQSARFHCVHSAINGGGLSHKSYCTLRADLEASGCDGAASCSCTAGTECWSCDTLGGCGSSPSDRASIFGFQGGSVSEVGAAGADAWGSVRMWVGECPPDEPHRNTVTNGSLNVVGTGYATGSSCWGAYAFSDFGKMSGVAPARIPSGVYYAGRFYANYYDVAGDPQGVYVVVDGTCQPMTVEIGDTGNRTYVADANLAQGCHEYYFVATDAAGQLATYPTLGSLTAGSGCPDPYVPSQQASSCSPGNDAGAGGGGGGGGGNGVGGSAHGVDGSTASGGAAGTVGGSSGTGASSAAAAPSAGDPSGCACRTSVPSAQAPRGVLAFAVALVALGLRGRRRRARTA